MCYYTFGIKESKKKGGENINKNTIAQYNNIILIIFLILMCDFDTKIFSKLSNNLE